MQTQPFQDTKIPFLPLYFYGSQENLSVTEVM